MENPSKYNQFMRLFVTASDGLKFIIAIDRASSGQDLSQQIAEQYDNIMFRISAPGDFRLCKNKVRVIRSRGYILNIPDRMQVAHFLADQEEIECEMEPNVHNIKEEPKQKPERPEVDDPKPQKKVKKSSDDDEIDFDRPVEIQPHQTYLHESITDNHVLNQISIRSKSPPVLESVILVEEPVNNSVNIKQKKKKKAKNKKQPQNDVEISDVSPKLPFPSQSHQLPIESPKPKESPRPKESTQREIVQSKQSKQVEKQPPQESKKKPPTIQNQQKASKHPEPQQHLSSDEDQPPAFKTNQSVPKYKSVVVKKSKATPKFDINEDLNLFEDMENLP